MGHKTATGCFGESLTAIRECQPYLEVPYLIANINQRLDNLSQITTGAYPFRYT